MDQPTFESACCPRRSGGKPQRVHALWFSLRDMIARLALLLACTALAAGCASYSGYNLRPGVATEAQVRAAMGPPAVEFANADGSRRLAYPRGPYGTQTFMADVGADGILQALRPVLDDDNFHRIQPGMRRKEVLRLIGPPRETMAFARTRHVAWDYFYMDTWGYHAIFSVTFDADGVVVSKISQRLERERRRGF